MQSVEPRKQQEHRIGSVSLRILDFFLFSYFSQKSGFLAWRPDFVDFFA